MSEQSIDAGKALAALLLRLGLGIILAFYGLQKIFAYPDVVNMLIGGFQGKFQPFILVKIFLYLLPFIELIGGLLLISGYRHKLVLFIMGLVIITLMVGNAIQQDYNKAAMTMIYLLTVTFSIYNSNNDIFRAGD